MSGDTQVNVLILTFIACPFAYVALIAWHILCERAQLKRVAEFSRERARGEIKFVERMGK